MEIKQFATLTRSSKLLLRRSSRSRRTSSPPKNSSPKCGCESCSLRSLSLNGAPLSCDSLEPASNAPAATSRSGFIGAAKDIGKFAILGAVLLVLVALRTEGGVIAGIGLTAAAVFGVYIAFGKRQGLSQLLVYMLGFALFAQLRAFGDETGIPYSFTYVASLDGVLGANPSAWLQDNLYAAGRYGVLEYATSACLRQLLRYAARRRVLLMVAASRAVRPLRRRHAALLLHRPACQLPCADGATVAGGAAWRHR